jgi:hypothetical protein
MQDREEVWKPSRPRTRARCWNYAFSLVDVDVCLPTSKSDFLNSLGELKQLRLAKGAADVLISVIGKVF